MKYFFKKKLLTILTCIMLCALCVFTFTACDDNNDDNDDLVHTHTYVESITAPTCTDQGFSTYTCSCGDSYIENYVKALGHTETVDSAVAPTCTETGLTEGKHCSVCDEVIVVQQTVSATGHSFTQENTSNAYLKTEATCTNVAVYWESCSCGQKGSETFEYGTTLPHDFGAYSKTENATCTENAKETAYCEDCGEPDVRDIDGTALGHGTINTSNVCSVCNKEVAYIKGMVYVAVTGGYQLIDMGSATDTDVIIPKYYNGSPVISIADEVFKNKKTLTSIVIPDSIVKIGDEAFWGCREIKELILPKSVKSIGYSAFARCVSLEYLTVPCFQREREWAMDTTYDELPLYRMFVESKIGDYIPDGAEGFIYGSSAKYYWFVPEKLRKITVLDSVENIIDSAVHGFRKVKEIELPETINTIGSFAFDGCYALEKINIPKNVTTIGQSAFSYCDLVEITIPYFVNSIGPRAFIGCSQLSKVAFKNQSAWTVDGNAIDVSDDSTNAILFKKTYVNSSWSRS